MAVSSLILRGLLTLTRMLPQSGGALSVGFDGSHVRVQESRFESNHAKVCNSSSVSIIHDLTRILIALFWGYSVGGWGRSVVTQGWHGGPTAFDVPIKFSNKQH